MKAPTRTWLGTQQLDKAFGKQFWTIFAGLVVSLVAISAVFWVMSHPYGTNWDEARYINRAYRDVALFRQGGWGQLIQAIWNEDRTRPPAFRLVILPLTLTIGVNSTLLRLVSLGFIGGSLGFVYLAAKRLAGSAVGAFAVIFLATCPIVVAPSMRFYVDFPLYLAIAAILYFLLADWDKPGSSRNWIGLGLALALGVMAKPPILFIAAPMLLLTLILSWRKWIVAPTLPALFKAGSLAAVCSLPWWVFNFRPALAKAFRSGKYVRHSLGDKGSLETVFTWLHVFYQSMLGPALTLLTLAIVISLLVQWSRKQVSFSRSQLTAIAVCLAGALPMLAIAAVATNQNPRLIAPALVPLALALSLIAGLTRWTTSRWLAATATAVFCFQLAVMLTPTASDGRYQTGDPVSQTLLWGNPTTTMKRLDQWDWSPLRQLCLDRNLPNPEIGYLGNSITFNIPQIAYPWVKANQEIRVRWLWQYVLGELGWNQVMAAANASDVVLTAPTLVGNAADRQDLDNQHNAEFARRLQQQGFAAPIALKMGRFEPVEVLVFFHKSDQARSAQKLPPPAPFSTGGFGVFD